VEDYSAKWRQYKGLRNQLIGCLVASALLFVVLINSQWTALVIPVLILFFAAMVVDEYDVSLRPE